MHAVCAVTRPRASIESAVYLYDVTYALRHGQITAPTVPAIGTAKRLTLAVTGGSGAYDGARGQIVSKQGRDTITPATR
jgi:hypothetical protein